MISVVSVWTRINMQIFVWYWQIYPVVKFKHGTGGYSDVEHALRASVLQCSCFQHCVWFVMQYCQHTKHPTSSDIVTVTAARRSEHMIHILRDLYCLPVRHRITFKTAVLVYKCLHGMALQYLQTYCEPTSTVTSRRLRSAHFSRLTLPRTRTNYGDQLHRPRTSGVEQSSFWTVYTGHHALNVQKQTLEFCSTCNCYRYTAHLQLFCDLVLHKCTSIIIFFSCACHEP